MIYANIRTFVHEFEVLGSQKHEIAEAIRGVLMGLDRDMDPNTIRVEWQAPIYSSDGANPATFHVEVKTDAPK